MKGTGKVAFLAHRAEIEAELEAGWPVKAVYQKRVGALGMSYAQFTRYVATIIRGSQSRPAPISAGQAQAPEPASAAPTPPHDPAPRPNAPPTPQGTDHARHQPARGFFHDPLERPDDRKRLLGE